jgi:hypothetical protein
MVEDGSTHAIGGEGLEVVVRHVGRAPPERLDHAEPAGRYHVVDRD